MEKVEINARLSIGAIAPLSTTDFVFMVNYRVKWTNGRKSAYPMYSSVIINKNSREQRAALGLITHESVNAIGCQAQRMLHFSFRLPVRAGFFSFLGTWSVRCSLTARTTELKASSTLKGGSLALVSMYWILS